MKRTLLLMAILMSVAMLQAQRPALKSGIPSERAKTFVTPDNPTQSHIIGRDLQIKPRSSFKGTDVVSIISIGTSANAFGYGYAGGQKNLVNYDSQLNTVTNFHRMGGELDPGGYSGDLGYDISTDGGLTWTSMIECYVATNNAGGQYFTDAARYPNHGLYNPEGNSDPNEAYVTFFAPNLDESNEPGGFGGYSYGRAKVGNTDDTTKHLRASRPQDGVYQYTPDGYCLTGIGDVWVVDDNRDMINTPNATYMGSLIVNHGVWNEELLDYEYEETLFELSIQPGLTLPAYQDVEFSPDGQYGYIVTLADDGSVDISTDVSYYPIIWRTEDYGETWSDPIPVAIAGSDGIGAVLDYLSDEEIAELFDAPVPDRDEIAFTTAFDYDISVDKVGNPHIAIVCGVTGSDPYTIVSGISESSGYYFNGVFLLSSMDKGEEGSWIGYELARPVSFRGEFDTDFDEDNRIQISRDAAGEKMFVSWLDTDTTVSLENNAPDIWARAVDVIEHLITVDPNGEPKPVNVTFGSEATFSAYFFAQSNEVITNGNGTYTIPYVYEDMTPTDPNQPVQFKYIQDFSFADEDFQLVGIESPEMSAAKMFEVSGPSPNPAADFTRLEVKLKSPATIHASLYSLTGQRVLDYPVKYFTEGTNIMKIDLSDIPPGAYFLRIMHENNQVTHKLIVE